MEYTECYCWYERFHLSIKTVWHLLGMSEKFFEREETVWKWGDGAAVIGEGEDVWGEKRIGRVELVIYFFFFIFLCRYRRSKESVWFIRGGIPNLSHGGSLYLNEEWWAERSLGGLRVINETKRWTGINRWGLWDWIRGWTKWDEIKH